MEEKLERARRRIILALDVNSLEEANAIIEKYNPYVGMFKVGIELVMIEGVRSIANAIARAKSKTFLDLKFKDTAKIVGNAVKIAADYGIEIVSVSANSGFSVAYEAVKNAGVTSVYYDTVVTSNDENHCHFSDKGKVLMTLNEAHAVNCKGIVCSFKDLAHIKDHPGTHHLKIAASSFDFKDSKNLGDAFAAIENGAYYLIVNASDIITEDEENNLKAINGIITFVSNALSYKKGRE